MARFWTADTHFSSERTLTLSRRPFDNINEMNIKMIDEWNRIVSPNDEVIHVGDFGDYKYVKKLNGKIHLILGNYELKDIEEGKITIEQLKEIGFASVQKNIIIDNFNIELPNIKKIFVTHEPSDCTINDTDFFNIFGHIHGRQLCKRFGLDVGVDGHHFRPVSDDDISFYMTAINKYYDENVFM